MPDGHDAYAALRNPNYRRLLLGTLLASAGGEMQSVAVGWELYQRTDSATALVPRVELAYRNLGLAADRPGRLATARSAAATLASAFRF